MRCSQCGEVVRPVVAVDIDGTLGDYHTHFLRFACDYFGWDRYLDDYDGSESFKKWWMDGHGASAKDWHDVKLAYRQGGMKRTMPKIPGATEFMQKLNGAGCEVWITTTRPYLSLDNIVPDTVEFCHRHHLDYEGILFDDDKYHQLAARVDPERVVAVYDDLPEMVAAADDIFGPVGIMARSKYNSAYTGSLDTREATREILTRVRDWHQAYA